MKTAAVGAAINVCKHSNFSYSFWQILRSHCLNFASFEITPEKFCYAGVLFLLCIFWFTCLLDLYALILDFEYILVYRYCS